MNEAQSPNQLATEGKASYKNGDFLVAAQAFEAASHAYAAGGDVLMAAEMANNCSVAYLQADDAEKAYQVVEGTPETFAEAGDLRRQGMAFGNQGAALEALGRLEEAVEAYQQSATLLEQAGEDRLRSNVMQSLSGLQVRMGKQLEALATMQSGLEGVKAPSPQQRFLKQLLKLPSRLLNK